MVYGMDTKMIIIDENYIYFDEGNLRMIDTLLHGSTNYLGRCNAHL